MGVSRLKCQSILSKECDLTNDISFEDVIKKICDGNI